MPEDYYQQDQEPNAQEKGAKDEAPEENTFLAPKSAVKKDANPGDKCEFEIVHVYEDEVELKWVKDGEYDKPKAMDEAMSGMDSMAGDKPEGE